MSGAQPLHRGDAQLKRHPEYNSRTKLSLCVLALTELRQAVSYVRRGLQIAWPRHSGPEG